LNSGPKYGRTLYDKPEVRPLEHRPIMESHAIRQLADFRPQ
jgi:hypothetical protein